MTAAIGQSELRLHPDEQTAITPRDIILLRIAATGGATRADLQRDVATLLTRRMSSTEFRQSAELAISSLTGANFVTEAKGRLSVAPKGLEAAMASLRPARPTDLSWNEIRTALMLRALAAADTSAIRKALQRVEGLAAIVLQHHFGKATDRVRSPANLRADLAIVALERAFGNKIKTSLGKGNGLPAKAGRLLAGQLFKSPRELASDGKLIVSLACEITGTRDVSLPALELAVLRRLFAPAEREDTPPSRRRTEPPASDRRLPRRDPPRAANDRTPLSGAVPLAKTSPPDLTEFCAAVVDAARPVAEGWPGNRKAFISLVWKAIRHSRPDWGLSEVAFKGMLAEAHRSGHIELATADLKDGRDLASLEDSKILYKNTVWHFVRVQD